MHKSPFFARRSLLAAPIASWLAGFKRDIDFVFRATTQWLYSTSSGPGGQAVNRRLSRAELRLLDGPATCNALPADLVAFLRSKRLADGSVLMAVRSEVHRSLVQNKAQCVLAMHQKLYAAAQSIMPPAQPTPEQQSRVEELRKAEKRRCMYDKQMEKQRKASRKLEHPSNRL